MNRFLATATATAVLVTAGFAAPPVSAASILIDNFADTQRVEDTPGSFDNSGRVSGGMVGGSRLMQVETDSLSTLPGATNLTAEAVATGSELKFSNNTNDTGRGWVVYDGLPAADAGGAPINQGPLTAVSPFGGIAANRVFDIQGVLGLDLTFGGFSTSEVFFNFDFDLDLEGPLYFAGAVYDGTNYAFFDEVFPQGGPPDSRLFLNQFSLFSGAFDWSSVQGIGFLADSVWQDGGITGGNMSILAGSRPSFDGGIRSVTVEVIPLPASVLLLLGGLGSFAGLSVVARRRRTA